MNTPLQKKLTELFPVNIQLLHGLLRAGGVIVDKESQTMTLSAPYQYVISELEQQRTAVLQYQQEYLRQYQTENNDFTLQMPVNEQQMFLDILKIYDYLLQIIS